jgi:hypothetical protein
MILLLIILIIVLNKGLKINFGKSYLKILREIWFSYTLHPDHSMPGDRIEVVYIGPIEYYMSESRKVKEYWILRFLIFEITFRRIVPIKEVVEIYPSGYNYKNDPEYKKKLKRLEDTGYFA